MTAVCLMRRSGGLAWLSRIQKIIEKIGILECDMNILNKTAFQVGIANTAKVVTRYN